MHFCCPWCHVPRAQQLCPRPPSPPQVGAASEVVLGALNGTCGFYITLGKPTSGEGCHTVPKCNDQSASDPPTTSLVSHPPSWGPHVTDLCRYTELRWHLRVPLTGLVSQSRCSFHPLQCSRSTIWALTAEVTGDSPHLDPLASAPTHVVLAESFDLGLVLVTFPWPRPNPQHAQHEDRVHLGPWGFSPRSAAPRQDEYGGRAWPGRAVHLMAARKQREGKREEGKGLSSHPPFPMRSLLPRGPASQGVHWATCSSVDRSTDQGGALVAPPPAPASGRCRSGNFRGCRTVKAVGPLTAAPVTALRVEGTDDSPRRVPRVGFQSRGQSLSPKARSHLRVSCLCLHGGAQGQGPAKGLDSGRRGLLF